MSEERKGTAVEAWDAVKGQAGDDPPMQDVTKDAEGRTQGERFIALRNSTGMSRKDFAEYLNIPYTTMSDWEHNLRTMPNYVFALIEFKVNYDLGKDPRALGSQMRGIEDMVEQNDNSFDGIINNVPAAPVPDFAEINEKADQEDIIADTKASVMEKIKEQQEKVKLAPIPEPEKKTPVICPCREM